MPETPPPDPTPSNPQVLGVDPVEPTKVPDLKPVEVPKVEEKPEGVTLTQDQYDELTQKAGNFDVISGDEVAMNMLHTHFSDVNSKESAPASNIPPDTSDYGKQITEINERMDRMTSVGENIQETLATMALSSFGKDNPEFENHRVAIGKLMTEYPGMPLDKALKYAQSEAGPSEPASKSLQPAAPTQPVVEVDGVGIIPGAGSSLEEAERRITDSKLTPDFGDAVKIAVAAAQKEHGM